MNFCRWNKSSGMFYMYFVWVLLYNKSNTNVYNFDLSALEIFLGIGINIATLTNKWVIVQMYRYNAVRLWCLGFPPSCSHLITVLVFKALDLFNFLETNAATFSSSHHRVWVLWRKSKSAQIPYKSSQKRFYGLISEKQFLKQYIIKSIKVYVSITLEL